MSRGNGRQRTLLDDRDGQRLLEGLGATVQRYYGLAPADLGRRGDAHIARLAAAWLARRQSKTAPAELALKLGPSRAESVPNLTRALQRRLKHERRLRVEVAALEEELETKNKI